MAAGPAIRAASRPGPLAQLVEQGTLNPKVEGSSPSRPTEVLAYAASGRKFPLPMPIRTADRDGPLCPRAPWPAGPERAPEPGARGARDGRALAHVRLRGRRAGRRGRARL